MRLSGFNYEIPQGLIAIHPEKPRDSAKLMVISRDLGEITHSHFYDLPNFLQKGDFLVFNQSKVIPARLFGKVDGKDMEVLLTSPCHSECDSESSFIDIDSRLRGNDNFKKSGMTTNIWQAMVKPAKRLKMGSKIEFSSKLTAEVVDISVGVFKLNFNIKGNDFWREVDETGEMPLPPYILKQRHEKHGESIDKNDYQTVYADKPGSVAAPTAGLHFTEDLIKRIQKKGCDIGFVDLHVGLGTFEPIRTENIEDHKIHSEYFELSANLADKLNQAKKEGRRIIAVGTTTVRVLETVFGVQGSDPCRATRVGPLQDIIGETNIYIYPGYKFQFVDGMITNFHLPKSSLLLLISAFWTRANVLKAYHEAIKNNYKFYSYGDGMFIN